MDKEKLNEIWEETQPILKQRLLDAIYNMWIRPLKLTDLDEAIATVELPPDHSIDIFEHMFEDSIRESLSEVLKAPIRIVFTETCLPPVVSPVYERLDLSPGIIDKIKKYQFDNFPITVTNGIALKTVLNATIYPCESKYLIVICGLTNQERQHLMWATVNRIADRSPDMNLVFKTIETFISEIIIALRCQDNRYEKYNNECRSADFFLLRDIKLIENTPFIQNEFYKLLKFWIAENKQVVILSDVPIEKLKLENGELYNLLKEHSITILS